MGWLCTFMQCNWLWLFNVRRVWTDGEAAASESGVYQCQRCKTISLGAPR